jgi:hypothetical protein
MPDLVRAVVLGLLGVSGLWVLVEVGVLLVVRGGDDA